MRRDDSVAELELPRITSLSSRRRLTREALSYSRRQAGISTRRTGDVSSETYRHTGTHIYLSTYLPACLPVHKVQSGTRRNATYGRGLGRDPCVRPGSDTQPWSTVDTQRKDRGRRRWQKERAADKERRIRVADGDGDRRRRFLGSSSQREDERRGQRRAAR